ncbi:MAG: hypothetical protein EPO31_04945 [Gammaproteobacteria bacterium]|nr:MAG: hypothetical protein EPO31_04945 [Gammaproteobacteria bacterium]
MKIDIDYNPKGYNKIQGYSAGKIIIAGRDYTSSLILMRSSLISDWPPERHTDMRSEHFSLFLELKPEVLLIGTGRKLEFLNQEITLPLQRASIGCEVMDTGAACRTYNYLVDEGRDVAAALLMIEPSVI